MDLIEIVPPLAAVVALATFVVVVRTAGSPVRQWWVPAVPLVLFTAWSVYAVAAEGVGGFWPEHTGTVWEAQIWMDLLLMASAAWWLAQPRLRASSTSPWPWLVVVLATGSIGMLAMLLWIRRSESRGARGPGAAAGVEVAATTAP